MLAASTYSGNFASLLTSLIFSRSPNEGTFWIATQPPSGTAAADEVLKARIVAPGSFIVSPSGIEDAALALGADPGPRLFLTFFHAIFEYGAIFFIVLGVDIGLVPTLETTSETFP